MKRVNQLVGLLLIITFVGSAWCSAIKGMLTQQTATGLTAELNRVARMKDVPMNYFQVQTITFEQENKRIIGDQQQRELSFSYSCQVVEPANG